MRSNLVRFVLVRPEEAGNIGAAARVLANFDYTDLVLVSPRWARPEEAVKWARGAEDLLEGATIVSSLKDAVADCASVFATTRRRGRQRNRFLDPREAAHHVRSRSAETAAWVFGPESRGLPTEEVALCTARVTIPTGTGHPSLNLAQAVAVCAYETFVAGKDQESRSGPRSAPHRDREALYDHLRSSLLDLGFLLPHTAGSRMGVLRRLLERAELTPAEVRYLRGLARKISWAADQIPPGGEESKLSGD